MPPRPSTKLKAHGRLMRRVFRHRTPRQRQWHTSLDTPEVTHQEFLAPRRSGKTAALAMLAAAYIRSYPDVNVIVMSVDRPSFNAELLKQDAIICASEGEPAAESLQPNMFTNRKTRSSVFVYTEDDSSRVRGVDLYLGDDLEMGEDDDVRYLGLFTPAEEPLQP